MSSLVEDQEVVDIADAVDHQEVVTVVTVVDRVLVEDTAEDHRQVVLVVGTAVDRVLEDLEDTHLLVVTKEAEDTKVVDRVLVEDIAVDHRQVVQEADTRADETEDLDIVVLRVEGTEVTHSATMVHLAHLAVSTQIVHVHLTMHNSYKKNSERSSFLCLLDQPSCSQYP